MGRQHPKLDVPLVYCGRRGPVAIYAVVDPVTLVVVYVGKTNNPDRRLSQHLVGLGATCHEFRDWCSRMVSEGNPPLMVILAKVGLDEWPAAEREWVAHYRSRGWIFNVDDGGKLTRSRETFRDDHGRVRRVGWLKDRMRKKGPADPPVKVFTAEERAALQEQMSRRSR